MVALKRSEIFRITQPNVSCRLARKTSPQDEKKNSSVVSPTHVSIVYIQLCEALSAYLLYLLTPVICVMHFVVHLKLKLQL